MDLLTRAVRYKSLTQVLSLSLSFTQLLSYTKYKYLSVLSLLKISTAQQLRRGRYHYLKSLKYVRNPS